MPSHQDEIIDCIFLMTRLMRANMSFSSALMKLSSLQLYTLIFLNQHKNAPMTEIAQEFNIELSSATSLVNNLVKMGLVERKHDKGDRRLVRIVLSKKGSILLQKAMAERSKKIKMLLSSISSSEQHQLLLILHKFTKKLEDVNEK